MYNKQITKHTAQSYSITHHSSTINYLLLSTLEKSYTAHALPSKAKDARYTTSCTPSQFKHVQETASKMEKEEEEDIAITYIVRSIDSLLVCECE